ncbi:MAG: hypothetical protein HY901_34995 [Deltaproteobacteria bacterium]|nr:hypothetical protein [Deltaproteobacteria bacterium]
MRPTTIFLYASLLLAACSEPPARDCGLLCEKVTSCQPGSFALQICQAECEGADADQAYECSTCAAAQACGPLADGACNEACAGFSFAESCSSSWEAGGVACTVTCQAGITGSYSCGCLRNGVAAGAFGSNTFCAAALDEQQTEAHLGCNLEWPGKNDLLFRWSFAGRSCALAPEVKSVRVTLTGPEGAVAIGTLGANLVACASNGVDGYRHSGLKGADYSYQLEGRDGDGRVRYAASGTLSLFSARTVTVDLQPVP